MPQIIVAANGLDRFEEAVTLRERINASDFESDHFARQLVERLTWAVSDAHATEQIDFDGPEPGHIEGDTARASAPEQLTAAGGERTEVAS